MKILLSALPTALLLFSHLACADVGGIDVDATLRRMHDSDLRYREYQTSRRDADNRLPQIGTPGSSVITVQEERVFGRFYFRKARENLKVIADPALDDYIKNLGSRLISHANNVHFPYNFFITQDPTINASAFLGGNVRVHTGLVLFTDNESQLASVLAHEITHVTQRHIARFLEAAAARQPLTIGAFVGGVILAIINPALGMATLQTTLGLNMQAQIDYTRNDEMEADHIGIDLMYRSGFDPTQMAQLFSRMTSLSYKNIPQGLLTHPIPERRVSDARARADRMPRRGAHESPEYCFAKARIRARFAGMTPEAVIDYYQKALNGKTETCSRDSLLYGLTLGYVAQKNGAKARETFGRISSSAGGNYFLLDTATDISIMNREPAKAVALLAPKYNLSPANQTVAINYAAALQAAGRYSDAIAALKKFIGKNPENMIAHDLLAQNYRRLGRYYEYYVSLAELNSLAGDFDRSNANLNRAARYATTRLEKAKLDAMVVRNEQIRLSDRQFTEK
ncbi:MAG: M48 family metallopeptidase [Succinivibrionaceae bacterium]|nr:M48 family metallopeptidase [Succinivibrionaceae bacterium]